MDATPVNDLINDGTEASAQILIVDDSAVMRRGVEMQLKGLGAEIFQAEDGQQGLELALSKEFDLIVTDIEMPRLDGYGLCRELKKNDRTRGVPVVMLSSLDTDRDIDKGFEVGAAAYVPKSTNSSTQLVETVERVLEKASFQRERLILVVDDSPIIIGIVKRGLLEAGFQVMTAENGRMGLECMKRRRPDLILSDIEMPVMNGEQFCSAVHSDKKFATIPFVIMSTKTDRSLIRRMLHEGAAGYLAKPFNLEQLIITVERLLSDHFLLLIKEKERMASERRMMLSGITSLIEALEARDHYTRGHSESVARIVTGMAKKMGVGSDEIEMLKIGGRLHDLGKIGVPDHILLKPGRLTEEEFSIIQRHPLVGATILGPIETLVETIPIVLYHHERIDGKGYPHGLKGDEIPIWARVTAVADTYHALTSDRPYRKGMPKDRAYQIMEDAKGTQLCPECLDIFFTIENP